MNAELDIIASAYRATQLPLQTWLVWLWAGSDFLIFAAFMAISMTLILVLRRRPDLAHRGLVNLFAAFILLCGLTYALDGVTQWLPIQPLALIVKLATAVTAIATAGVLFRLVPTFVRIPTPETHDEVIAQLEVTLADLSRVRDNLETRVRDRTEELKNANTRLAVTARDAVQRSRNLIQLVSSLTRPGADVNENPARFLRELRGRINALAIATSTVMEQGDDAKVSLERAIRRQLEPHFSKPQLQIATKGEWVAIGVQGAQQISLIAWELASRIAQMNRQDRSNVHIGVSWTVKYASDANGAGPGYDELHLQWRESLQSSDGAASHHEDFQPILHTPDPLAEFSETLLTGIVPRLLCGKGRIDIEPGTFIYTLTCPLLALSNSAEVASEIPAGPGHETTRLKAPFPASDIASDKPIRAQLEQRE